MSGQQHDSTALYPRDGLGGPQGRSGRSENLVPTGIRSRTFHPIVTIPSELPGPHLRMYLCVYIYIYICMCVCVCACVCIAVCVCLSAVAKCLLFYVQTGRYFCTNSVALLCWKGDLELFQGELNDVLHIRTWVCDRVETYF